FQEYYIFNERGIHPTATSNAGGLRIATDAIAYCPSGLVDQTHNQVLSYLHKAIKPVNQLRMIEDAVVIYRIARAPERRIFYIDVGNLPKIKAEQYLRDVMARYRNKLVYDASTGEIRDDRNYMSMLEDFWLPRREGGRGTEITTLPGGQNLGEIQDIEYFQKKLYRSLNIPISRLEGGQGFNLGRAAEISRDE
ncbi:MAG: portal protein, partial [Pseudomonadota bacterium]|nr:portal protein [Pseudomonadota bacterium]